MKKLLLVGVAAVLLSACSGEEAATASPESVETPVLEETEQALEDVVTPDELTIELAEYNESGIEGTAQFLESEDESQVQVTINATGIAADAPASIRLGECAAVGAEVYSLGTVSNGTLATSINTALQPLLDSADELSLVIGAAGAEADAYVACGEID